MFAIAVEALAVAARETVVLPRLDRHFDMIGLDLDVVEALPLAAHPGRGRGAGLHN